MSQLEINPDNKIPPPIAQEEGAATTSTGQVKMASLLLADSIEPSAAEIQTLNIEGYSIEPGRPTIPLVNITILDQAKQTNGMDPKDEIANNDMAKIGALAYLDEAGKILKSGVAQEAKKVESLISQLENTLAQLEADNALTDPQEVQWTKDKIAEFKETLTSIKAGEEGKGKWIKMAALNELTQNITALTHILSTAEVAKKAQDVNTLISQLENTVAQLEADNALAGPEDAQWIKAKIAEFKEALASMTIEGGASQEAKMAALNDLTQEITELTNILSSGEVRVEDLLTQAKEKLEKQLADDTISPELAEKLKEKLTEIEKVLNQIKELEKAAQADSGLTWAKTGSLFALARALLELIEIMNELELKDAQAANTLNAAETKMGGEIAQQIEVIGRLRAAEKMIQAAQSLTSAGIGALQVRALANNTTNVKTEVDQKVIDTKAALDTATQKERNTVQGQGVAEQPAGVINPPPANPPAPSPELAKAQTAYDNALAAAAPREMIAQTNINATEIQARYNSFSQSVQGAGTMASAGMEGKIAEEESEKQKQEVTKESLRKTEEKTNKNANDMGNMRSGEYQVFVKLTEASHKRASSAA